MSQEMRTASLQELGPRYYREQVAAAQAALEGRGVAEGISSNFVQDERFERARQELYEKKMEETARYAVGLVGKVDVSYLREMVKPESLREVLLRGQAGLEVLMQVREGRAELEQTLAACEERAQSLRVRAAAFERDPAKKFALDRAWNRVEAALKDVRAFDKPIWSEKDALRFLSARGIFSTVCEGFQVDLARWEHDAVKVEVTSAPDSRSLSARQAAEEAFARLSRKTSPDA